MAKTDYFLTTKGESLKRFAERKENEVVTVGSFSDLTFPDPPFEELTNHFRSFG